MIAPPPWYRATDAWLQREGWPAMLVAAGALIGVTLWLIYRRQAAPLALWLTYLYMP